MIETVQTVKIQGQGYLLNGTMSVPKEDEDLQEVITQRNTYREFIRENS